MTQTTFDPAAYENMILEETNETDYTPIPEGDYTAVITGSRVKGITPSKGDNAGKTVPVLELTYQLEDPDGTLAEETNMEHPQIREDLWLDVNEQGGIAFGPNLNVRLGQRREACGLNKPGKPFNFKMFEGCGPLVVSVIVDPNEETGRVYNRVRRVKAHS